MERVLEHDLRCENLGFSVMIFSDRGQTSERHTVTRRVSPITSAPSSHDTALHRMGTPDWMHRSKSCVCRPEG
jgi:hypothetical protein